MFDLEALLTSLRDGGVDHVVIGGVAVGAHGYIRATEDLDIVPEPTPGNHERLASLLEQIGATLPTAGDRRFDSQTDLGALRRGENVSVETAIGSLDVVQLARGVPSYAELSAGASETELLAIPVRVCSLSQLRAMKSAAGRSQDRADLENLPEAY